MPSLKSIVLASAALLVSAVKADYYIDPKSVPLSTRTSWCSQELSTCPLICNQMPPGTTTTNTCDPNYLTYGCVCGNGQKPNVSEYTLTLPYFTCTEYVIQCTKACGSDNTCVYNCRADNPCGAQDPPRSNATTTTATSSTSATADATTIFTDSSNSNKGNAASSTFQPGTLLPLMAISASFVLGFAVLL